MAPPHHFISHSSVDEQDFAIRLYDELKAGPPSIQVWLDKRDLKPAKDWDDQIVDAVRTCESLIFVMTRDSVKPQSGCKNEWSHALRYKKPVIPVLLHSDAEMPFRLGSRQYIDFTGDFGTGLAKLRRHITWMSSAEGFLQALKDRLEDAKRELPRASIEQQARINDEIAQLEKQIADQQVIVDNPERAQKRVEKSIAHEIERERMPERPISSAPCTKFINHPPALAPAYFQDRHVEIELMGDFLKNDAQSLMTIVGRAGIGKSVMVCRLLKALEGGRLPDDGGELSVDCIIYLSERGIRQVTVPNMYADMCRLLPQDVAEKLDQVYRDPRMSTGSKMQALLAAFLQGRVILLLDNFENLVDTEKHTISNAEMKEALYTVLEFPLHVVKLILTTRIAPRDLALFHPEVQMLLPLDKGLESPYAENILREMDVSGMFGLKNAPDALLDEARMRTQGNPRALEALFAILSADRETTLPEILNDTEMLLPEHVVEVLVGEAFSRLDISAQRVMQALAVYSRHVTLSAVDYLLQPYMQGMESKPVLKRLVNMRLVRKDEKYYSMHPVDRDYALSRMPAGTAADRITETPPFTRFALFHRGAEYFKLIRTPSENWKNINDLAPLLAEFDLRCWGEDYDTAADVLFKIDFDYLLLWGHFRLLIEMHRRLEGKLNNPRHKRNSTGNLGAAFFSMGESREAIGYYENKEYSRVIGMKPVFQLLRLSVQNSKIC
jgi:hypothetical protein